MLGADVGLKPGFLPRVLRDVGAFLVDEGHACRHIPGHGCEALNRIGVVESGELLKLLRLGVLFGILFCSRRLVLVSVMNEIQVIWARIENKRHQKSEHTMPGMGACVGSGPAPTLGVAGAGMLGVGVATGVDELTSGSGCQASLPP